MSNYESTAFSSEIVARFRGLIARYDINQADLAVLCDVSQSQFSKIIRGVRPISLDQFVALCDALDVSVDEIISDVTEYLANRHLHASPVQYVEDESRLPEPRPWHRGIRLDPWAEAAGARLGVGDQRDDFDLVANDSINEFPEGNDADYDQA